MKKTVVFDFDGVIHSYKSGWKGATIIPDEPVKGMPDAIRAIRERGYEVVIVSTRTATKDGIDAVKSWLDKYGIVVDRICCEKPPAYVYIDDRAIRFDGNASTLLSKIDRFKTWIETGNGKGMPLVNALREDAEWAHANEWETPITLGDNLDAAATLIESLSAQLDQVTRERDAAVEDLRNGSCSTCAFQSPCIVTGCVGDMGEACKQCPCLDCANGRNWQWRGVEKEVEG